MSTSTQLPPPIPARLAARAIDVLAVFGLNLALGQVIGFGAGWLVLGAALVLGYFVAGDTLIGATLGKLALGLRVVNAEGGRLSPVQALRRELFVVVGAVPFVGPILALCIWMWMLVTVWSSPLGPKAPTTASPGTAGWCGPEPCPISTHTNPPRCMMSADPLSLTFAALADPTRRAMLARLAHGPASVTELGEPFGA
jgi:hypothetical protein